MMSVPCNHTSIFFFCFISFSEAYTTPFTDIVLYVCFSKSDLKEPKPLHNIIYYNIT